MVTGRRLLLFCFFFPLLWAAGQTGSLREKIFMHFDKNEYVAGDTIWFKTYIADALTQKPSTRSGIYYVELINQQKDFVRRFNYHVVLGTSFGQIPTDTAYFEPGLYKIRAYTRWMLNFGNSLLYERDIVIHNADMRNQWFLNMAPPVFNEDSVTTRLTFTNELNQPQQAQAVAFELISGKRNTLLKDQLQLDGNGGIDVQFKLPRQYKDQPLRLKISDAANRTKKYLETPVYFKKPDTDLQFMPEGGHLVAELMNKVGFKAINQNGMGVDFEATIKDNEDAVVANIKPLYKGMGYFEFTPLPGKTYKAVLNTGKEFPLPAVTNKGILLKVESKPAESRVLITLRENQTTANRYQLAISTRGYNIYNSTVELSQGQATLAVPYVAFPSGVATIFLSDMKGMLISQRHFFADNKEALQIEISPSSEIFSKRDSVSLNVKVKDKEGLPVLGSFSMAVTDDRQVKKDALTDENIMTYLLIQSDLRGTIETPNYYFTTASDTAAKALDALMLTQGFVRYNWDSAKFNFQPETQYMVSGRVVNYFNKEKGLPNYGVSLYTYYGAKFRLKTQANEEGFFTFKNIPQFDTAMFYVSAKADTIEYKFGDRIRTKRFKVHIDVDKPVYASLNTVVFDHLYSTRFNLDSSVLTAMAKRHTRFVSNDPTMMEEVVVTTKDKKNKQNRLTGSDQLITEEEIKSADSNMDIFDFLKKYVKGYVGPTSLRPPEWDKGELNLIEQNYYGSIKGGKNKIIVFIDGQSLDDPFLKVNIDFRRLKPKDIKTIELVTSLKRSRTYNVTTRNLTGDETISASGTRDYTKFGRGGMDYYYLVITSQSKAGIGLVAESRNPGFDRIPTPVFHYGKSSYSPKYTAENKKNPAPDQRSTIYWEPTVVTNEKGEATVSFYTADNPGTYTISLQGLSLQGDIGVKNRKIKVVQ